MAEGIRDKVAILGMGCSKFGERWDCGPEQLMVEAFQECIEDAGIDKSEIQAAWYGHCYDELGTGKGALGVSIALRLPYLPVTRVENFCATGTEAFRGAVYSVASGASDISLAIGVEKLKDTGYGGLPAIDANSGALSGQVLPNISAPGSFAQLASAYRAKHNVSYDDLKRAIAQVSVKSHENGAKNPKAHLRKPVSIDRVMAAPMIADPLGLFDCCGVSDGSACAIVTTPEIAKSLGKTDLVSVKALQLAVSNGEFVMHVRHRAIVSAGDSDFFQCLHIRTQIFRFHVIGNNPYVHTAFFCLGEFSDNSVVGNGENANIKCALCFAD